METEGDPPLKDVVESRSPSRSDSRSGSRSASRSRTPPARDAEKVPKPSKDAKRIWVGGLPNRIKEEDLHDICERFGEVTTVNIRSSKVDTFAFIEFKDSEAATKATKEIDQSFIRGNRVKCHWAQLKDEESGGRKNRINQIWIGHLKENDEDALQDKFEKFGRIRSLKVRSNRADLFAFIEYETSEACDDACAEMNGAQFLGGEIRVAWAQERSAKKSTPRRGPRGRSYERRGRHRSRSPIRRFRRSRSPRGRGRGVPRGDYKLEIENIPHEMSWMDLKTLGREYGGAQSVTFARTWNEGKTCMGVLEFTSKSALRATMDSLHGHRINGQKVYCRAL